MLLVHNAGGSPGAILKGLKLKPGTRQVLRYSVKGEGDAGNVINMHPFRVQIAFPGVTDKQVSPWDDVYNEHFQTKELVFNVPAGITSADVELVVKSKGAVWFDKIVLEDKVETPEEKYRLVLDEPYYRNMIFASAPVDTVKGKLITDAGVSRARISLTGKNDKKLFEQEFYATNRQIGFTIPAAKLPVGKYRISAEFSTADGTPVTVSTSLQKLPPAPVEVVMKSDHNFYINGKVFYPVMFWRIVGGTASEEFAMSRGVNIRISGGGDFRVLCFAGT